MIKKLLAGVVAFLVGVLSVCVGFSVWLTQLMGRASDEDFFNE